MYPSMQWGCTPPGKHPLPSGRHPQVIIFIYFYHLCVILFTEGLCPSMHHRSHDQGVSVQGVSFWRSLSRGSLSRGVSVQVVSVQGRFCPRGSLSGGSPSRGVSVQGVCPGRGVSVQGGSLSEGISVWRGLCQGDLPRMVMHGRHASYWNAFLLK